jgi:hypothetical protein
VRWPGGCPGERPLASRPEDSSLSRRWWAHAALPSDSCRSRARCRC